MRKTQVSLPRKRLIELMQKIRFGSIESLRIDDGEPVLEPPPEVLRDIALGKDDRPHPAHLASDFALKREVVDLLELFDREQNVLIDRIVVQAGLPLRVRVRVSSVA